MAKLYTHAGVCKENGQWNFRATNRGAIYVNILEDEGKTDVLFVQLTQAMGKDDARKLLASKTQFAHVREFLLNKRGKLAALAVVEVEHKAVQLTSAELVKFGGSAAQRLLAA